MVKKSLALVLMLGFVAGCAEATPTTATDANPDPNEPIPFPPPNTPPVQQPKAKDEFSTTDRAQSERYMVRLQQRFQEIARERNAAVQQELLTELAETLKTLDGKLVTWEAPTQFSADGRSLVVDLGGKQRDSVFKLRTTNYSWGDDELKKVRVQLGRELATNEYRKLKGGERVKFKAIVEAELTQGGVVFNLVGRLVEDPFGKPMTYEPLQTNSMWAGQCVVSDPANKSPIKILTDYSLKIKITTRTKDTFTGTCLDGGGLGPFAVTGKINGDKVELTVHRGNSREQMPYFTTFKGTLTDGFLLRGTYDKGTFLFSLTQDVE